jgi:hypothetical protein
MTISPLSRLSNPGKKNTAICDGDSIVYEDVESVQFENVVVISA